MSTFTIDVAKDFSPRPFGRYKSDNTSRSAEVFRDTVLLPALARHDVVKVDLSGSNKYSSSFLEEAFGGLVRYYNYDKDSLHKKLIVTHELLPSIPLEIFMYIDAAKPGEKNKNQK